MPAFLLQRWAAREKYLSSRTSAKPAEGSAFASLRIKHQQIPHPIKPGFGMTRSGHFLSSRTSAKPAEGSAFAPLQIKHKQIPHPIQPGFGMTGIGYFLSSRTSAEPAEGSAFAPLQIKYKQIPHPIQPGFGMTANRRPLQRIKDSAASGSEYCRTTSPRSARAEYSAPPRSPPALLPCPAAAPPPTGHADSRCRAPA